jgi:phosphonate transport system ATP-binding protein
MTAGHRPEAVIAATGLHKRFGATVALDDVSVAVEAGEFVVLLGRSGSGKTTLFRCLSGLIAPDGGEVVIDGLPLRRLRGRRLARARRKIGVIFQQFNLIRRRSALDNVLAGRLGSTPLWRVVTRRFPAADRRLALSLLDRVGLLAQAGQRADSLSGGQQQRVAIARMLAQETHIVLADEPVASLDPESAWSVMSLLKTVTREHRIAVLCTLHQPDLAAAFADRILEMADGRLRNPS